MQINSIQTTQPSFGTKIRADYDTLAMFCTRSEMKRHFMKFVKELENNGRNDVLVMSKGAGDWDTNVLVYEIKAAKNKNGYDKCRQGETINLEARGNFLSGKGRCNDKVAIDRIRKAYNDAYNYMLKHCEWWPKKHQNDWSQYLI